MRGDDPAAACSCYSETFVITDFATSFDKLGIRGEAPQGIGGLNNHDIFLQSMLSSNLADSLNFETGVDMFFGNDDGFLGRFENNQRVFVRMRYVF